MKYSLKEHPYIIMLIVSLILVGGSILLTVILKGSPFGIVAIVIASLGTLFLTYSFIVDLLAFLKKKKAYQNENATNENIDASTIEEEKIENENTAANETEKLNSENISDTLDSSNK